MRVYLAGPMRQIKEFNVSAFRAWAARLRAQGHEVFSPAESTEAIYGAGIYDGATGDEGEIGVDRRAVFAADFAWLCASAEAVALMPGWEASKGATAERAVAIALGIKIIILE
jgi:nucleoside 2-deoxyribosyltransferase